MKVKINTKEAFVPDGNTFFEKDSEKSKERLSTASIFLLMLRRHITIRIVEEVIMICLHILCETTENGVYNMETISVITPPFRSKEL